MLKAENISSYYGNIQALDNVSIEVNKGEIVSIIGSNGAGKSTLLMTLCGIVPAKTGSIYFNNTEISSLPTHEIIRMGVSQSPEGRRIFPKLTVYENLLIGDPQKKEKEINLEEVKDSINNQNGLILCDSDEDFFPTPVTHAEKSNEVFIGRLRKDLWKDNRANFWIVSDNLRKGAAWNSYQILSSLIKNKSHELLNDEYAEVGDPIDARLNLAVSYIEMGKAYDAKAIIYEVFDLSPNFEQKNKADSLLQKINDQGS